MRSKVEVEAVLTFLEDHEGEYMEGARAALEWVLTTAEAWEAEKDE